MTQTRVRVAALGLAVVTVTLSVALSSEPSAEPASASDIGTRVCELLRTARTEPAAAGATFMADVHGPLHDVAATLAERDRAAAGRLLEAKNAVERALDSPQPSGPDLGTSLSNLAERLPDVSSCEGA